MKPNSLPFKLRVHRVGRNRVCALCPKTLKMHFDKLLGYRKNLPLHQP
jgi:hypothetical protein